MKEWFELKNGQQLFKYGKQALDIAEAIAEKCSYFQYDVEEEIYTDDGEKSCYNCLFRRWSKDSFTCRKQS